MGFISDETDWLRVQAHDRLIATWKGEYFVVRVYVFLQLILFSTSFTLKALIFSFQAASIHLLRFSVQLRYTVIWTADDDLNNNKEVIIFWKN